MTASELTHQPSPADNRPPLLRSVQVIGLFGRYSYQIDVPHHHHGRLLLLHGDNGAGKTTILRILWHLLSARDDRGHRTFLAQTPFEQLNVEFSDGSRLHLAKLAGLVGDFKIDVYPAMKPHFTALFSVDEDAKVPIRSLRRSALRQWDASGLLPYLEPDFEEYLRPGDDTDNGHEQFIDFLNEMAVNPVFLADDRTLHSDDAEIERLRERFGAYDERLPRDRRPLSGALAAVELRITLHRVNDWFRKLTLGGQNLGSAGANTIYLNVLRQLSHLEDMPEPTEAEYRPVNQNLRELVAESSRYEEFGLVPHFPAHEFLDLLAGVGPERRKLAMDILKPYLETLRTRYDALSQPERMLRALVYQMNGFLVDKRVTFSPQDGLTILTDDDGVALEPASLSSGERQLLMLLCTTILAGRDSRVFIVDEPELSMGVPWQRQLLKTLLDLGTGMPLQFIVATHSIEIATGEPESLVQLVRERYVPGSKH